MTPTTIAVEEYLRWLTDDERAEVNKWLDSHLPGEFTFDMTLNDDGSLMVEHMGRETFADAPLPDGVASFEKLKNYTTIPAPVPPVLVERFVDRRFGDIRVLA